MAANLLATFIWFLPGLMTNNRKFKNWVWKLNRFEIGNIWNRISNLFRVTDISWTIGNHADYRRSHNSNMTTYYTVNKIKQELNMIYFAPSIRKVSPHNTADKTYSKQYWIWEAIKLRTQTLFSCKKEKRGKGCCVYQSQMHLKNRDNFKVLTQEWTSQGLFMQIFSGKNGPDRKLIKHYKIYFMRTGKW